MNENDYFVVLVLFVVKFLLDFLDGVRQAVLHQDFILSRISSKIVRNFKQALGTMEFYFEYYWNIFAIFLKVFKGKFDGCWFWFTGTGVADQIDFVSNLIIWKLFLAHLNSSV